tara:strand:+ start:402 stop:815 length:414 start_codon:yes stop_codon:yes gene_type:complete
MASILRVNTLTDASSNNSVALETVSQGSAKAWVNFNGTGTVAIQDSFNVSGLTDNAVGDYTVVIGNDMANANYSYQATSSNWETASTADSYIGVSGFHGGQATGSQRIRTYRERYDVSTPTFKDPLTTNLSIDGDLA